MRTHITTAGAVFLLCVAACTSTEKAPADDSKLPALPHDTHSYAQPEEARVTHVSLDVTPDFASKRISGVAKLAIQ